MNPPNTPAQGGETVPCPQCNGSSNVVDPFTRNSLTPCHNCNASGRIPAELKVANSQPLESAPDKTVTKQNDPVTNGVTERDFIAESEHIAATAAGSGHDYRCLWCGQKPPASNQRNKPGVDDGEATQVMQPHEHKTTTATWTKHEPAYVTCSSCGDKGHYPISREWWWEHTGFWHSIKHWIKRRFTCRGRNKRT